MKRGEDRVDMKLLPKVGLKLKEQNVIAPSGLHEILSCVEPA